MVSMWHLSSPAPPVDTTPAAVPVVAEPAPAAVPVEGGSTLPPEAPPAAVEERRTMF